MPVAIVTGSGGLIGSEAVKHFVEDGFDVIGMDNDMRAAFFGPEASTARKTEELVASLGSSFQPLSLDIRDVDGVRTVFERNRPALIIHAAAQPSHDWAASDPFTDFSINANGTMALLEATRHVVPDATFIYMSTNKVYGDRPNFLPLVEHDTRLELPPEHEYFDGIPENFSIDSCLHSLFGVSKASADLMVQEYGRYFHMPTVCFRGGCLTGPSHAGAQLHGFLSYLMKCTVTGSHYTIFGYDGKQVRDNIHSADVVRAFSAFHDRPRSGAIYNLGGGRQSNCSMLEAIGLCEEIAARKLNFSLSDQARAGDHRWWISSLDAFQRDYPNWEVTVGIHEVLQQIHDSNAERWLLAPAS